MLHAILVLLFCCSTVCERMPQQSSSLQSPTSRPLPQIPNTLSPLILNLTSPSPTDSSYYSLPWDSPPPHYLKTTNPFYFETRLPYSEYSQINHLASSSESARPNHGGSLAIYHVPRVAASDLDAHMHSYWAPHITDAATVVSNLESSYETMYSVPNHVHNVYLQDQPSTSQQTEPSEHQALSQQTIYPSTVIEQQTLSEDHSIVTAERDYQTRRKQLGCVGRSSYPSQNECRLTERIPYVSMRTRAYTSADDDLVYEDIRKFNLNDNVQALPSSNHCHEYGTTAEWTERRTDHSFPQTLIKEEQAQAMINLAILNNSQRNNTNRVDGRNSPEDDIYHSPRTASLSDQTKNSLKTSKRCKSRKKRHLPKHGCKCASRSEADLPIGTNISKAKAVYFRPGLKSVRVSEINGWKSPGGPHINNAFLAEAVYRQRRGSLGGEEDAEMGEEELEGNIDEEERKGLFSTLTGRDISGKCCKHILTLR